MAAGNDHNWMVVGTSRGFHILYDLRFHLDVQVINRERERERDTS
jgi:hypothetical protein